MRWAKKKKSSIAEKNERSVDKKSASIFQQTSSYEQEGWMRGKKSKTWWWKRRDFPLFRAIDRRIQWRWCCKNFFFLVSNIELLSLFWISSYIHRINLPLLWSAKCFSFLYLFIIFFCRYQDDIEWKINEQNREVKIYGEMPRDCTKNNFYDVMFLAENEWKKFD